MTRIVQADREGGPEVLSVVEVDTPVPGAGEVLVDVRAAGVNPVDHKLYGGAMGPGGQYPQRVGMELAGVVAAVGEGAQGPDRAWEVGDEVIGFRVTGAAAEQVVVPAADLVPKPAQMSFEAAGGLMLTGTTAVHALTAVDVQVGDTVLVHGAAGGVGLMVVQLAKALGANVIGTASIGNHGVLQGYGVVPVEYGDGLADAVREVAADGVDAAIDCIGTDEAVDVSLDLVEDRSRIATIAAFGRAQDDGIKALGGGPGADPGTELRDKARLELVDYVEEGQLEVTVEATYPLAEARAAHEAVMAGHTHGKVVLVP
ncbi:NADP-dependent oxidoreductase [Rhodococcus aerolatus]